MSTPLEMGHFDNRGNYHWPGGGVTTHDGWFLSTVRMYLQDVSEHPQKAMDKWASTNGVEVLRAQPQSIADCWFFRIKHKEVELPAFLAWANDYRFE